MGTLQLTLSSMVRSSGPVTSYEAADAFSIAGLNEIKQDVFRFFLTQPKYRATDEQVEDALRYKYVAQRTVSKRRTDLTYLGILRNSGQKAKNRNGRNMIVWEIVPEYRPV